MAFLTFHIYELTNYSCFPRNRTSEHNSSDLHRLFLPFNLLNKYELPVRLKIKQHRQGIKPTNSDNRDRVQMLEQSRAKGLGHNVRITLCSMNIQHFGNTVQNIL